MKDGSIKICFAMGSIVALYGIYSVNNPQADGVLFGSVLALVAGLGGYTIATVKGMVKDG